MQGDEAAGLLDLGNPEYVRILKLVRSTPFELTGDGANRQAGRFGQSGQPVFVLVGEGERAVVAGARVHAPAEFGQHVVEIIVLLLVHHSNDGWRIPRRYEGIDQFFPGWRVNPQPSELAQRVSFLNKARGQPRPVLGNRDRHGLAVDVGNDEAARVGHMDIEPFDAYCGLGRRRRFRARPAATARRRFRDEILAEKACGIGVVVDPEHELAGHLVNPSTAPDHLVEADGRFEVLEEDDVLHARHVHAGCQQINGRGDEMAPGRSAEVRELVVSAACRGTLEGVVVQTSRRRQVGRAPLSVKIVHADGHVVGMAVSCAEDDSLLLRVAGFPQKVEQIRAHGQHTVWE